MRTLALRLAQVIGCIAAAASIGIVAAVIVSQVARGPEPSQTIWPSPRLWTYFANTAVISLGAGILAVFLAIPAAAAMVLARQTWQRALIRGLSILPLVTMPSIFAYAWLLLTTRPGGWIAMLLKSDGPASRAVLLAQAAWVLATWLWPIPAFILAASFRQAGLAAYQLARLDASSPRAFFRAALPTMRTPLIAAALVCVAIAAMDTLTCALVGAMQTWSVEMKTQSELAKSFARPAAFLVWANWPLLAAVLVTLLAAWPLLRATSRELDPGSSNDLGTAAAPLGLSLFAGLIVLCITIAPLVIFAQELGRSRVSAAVKFSTAWRTFSTSGLASLIVAALAALLSATIAIAAIDQPYQTRVATLLRRIAVAILIIVALLPAELIGCAMVSFYSAIGSASQWNIYDNSPWPWTAAMLARFAFVPVLTARWMARGVSPDLIDSARVDGASPTQLTIHCILPALAKPLAAASLITGCLCISEVSASILVQPIGFIGGSLAAAVDSQMHYQRQDQTTAMALMLMIPAFLGAMIFSFWNVERPRRMAAA